jgi:hypothetical protein
MMFASVVVCLLLAHVATQLGLYLLGLDTQKGLVRLFDLNQENNVPTWFASGTLLLCSLLLAYIALSKQRAAGGYAAHWLGLSGIFLFLSLDEVASIHELWGLWLYSRYRFTGYLFYAWVIPGSIIVCVVLMAYYRFLLHLPARTRMLFLLAGALYVGGAIGLDLPEGYYHSLYGNQTLVFSSMVLLEEGLEMVGVVVFLYALLSYVERQVIAMKLVIKSSREFVGSVDRRLLDAQKTAVPSSIVDPRADSAASPSFTSAASRSLR